MSITEEGTYPPVVIPETRGTLLIGFWFNPGDDLFQVSYPVLGWVVILQGNGDEAYGATPIICESLPEIWCLEHPNLKPRYIFPEDRSVDTMEDAIQCAKKMDEMHAEMRKRARERSMKMQAAVKPVTQPT